MPERITFATKIKPRGQLTTQSPCRVPATVQHVNPYWSFSKDVDKGPVCYSNTS